MLFLKSDTTSPTSTEIRNYWKDWTRNIGNEVFKEEIENKSERERERRAALATEKISNLRVPLWSRGVRLEVNLVEWTCSSWQHGEQDPVTTPHECYLNATFWCNWIAQWKYVPKLKQLHGANTVLVKNLHRPRFWRTKCYLHSRNPKEKQKRKSTKLLESYHLYYLV